jgi:bacteriocin-like protein
MELATKSNETFRELTDAELDAVEGGLAFLAVYAAAHYTALGICVGVAVGVGVYALVS